MTSREKFGAYCSLPGLLIVAILLSYPLGYNVYLSFMRYDNIQPVIFMGLANYRQICGSSDFWLSWRVSLFYSLGTTALTLLISLLLAHSLYGIRKWQTFFRTMVILPWAVPGVISGMMFRWIMDTDLGVLNYLLAELGVIKQNIKFLVDYPMLSGILATTWSYIPFMTVLILAGLESIPSELYEVAEIDGADSIDKFFHISLALNKTQILIAALIMWMFTFRTPDIFMSLTAGGPGKATYHAGIFLRDLIFKYMNFGYGSVVGVFLCLIVSVPASFILYKGVLKNNENSTR
ncbi:MAG TPA: sugar ABC transporter permease [Firmicutes bacterium]|nr:sugar ABC transporter permease [Bacillota bacterium]